MQAYDAIKWAVFLAITSLAERLGFEEPRERRSGLAGIVSDYVRFRTGSASGVGVRFGLWHNIPSVELQLANEAVPALIVELADAIFEQGGICRSGDRCIWVFASSRLIAGYASMIAELEAGATTSGAPVSSAELAEALKHYSGLPR